MKRLSLLTEALGLVASSLALHCSLGLLIASSRLAWGAVTGGPLVFPGWVLCR
jgi:hypothetical protein